MPRKKRSKGANSCATDDATNQRDPSSPQSQLQAGQDTSLHNAVVQRWRQCRVAFDEGQMRRWLNLPPCTSHPPSQIPLILWKVKCLKHMHACEASMEAMDVLQWAREHPYLKVIVKTISWLLPEQLVMVILNITQQLTRTKVPEGILPCEGYLTGRFVFPHATHCCCCLLTVCFWRLYLEMWGSSFQEAGEGAFSMTTFMMRSLTWGNSNAPLWPEERFKASVHTPPCGKESEVDWNCILWQHNRTYVPRGLCFLETMTRGGTTEVQIVIFALKKFTGGPGDDDDLADVSLSYPNHNMTSFNTIIS